MRIIINLIVITILPFLLVKDENPMANKKSYTCSSDFNICLQYPAILNPVCEEGSEEKGFSITNDDNTVTLDVYEANNLFDWNEDEIIHFNLSQYRMTKNDPRVLGQYFQELPPHSVMFSMDGYVHFQQIYLEGEKYFVLNISQKGTDAEALKELVSSIQLEHRA